MQLIDQIALLEENSVPIYDQCRIPEDKYGHMGSLTFYHAISDHEIGGDLIRIYSNGNGGVIKTQMGHVLNLCHYLGGYRGWHYGWLNSNGHGITWRYDENDKSFDVILIGERDNVVELLGKVNTIPNSDDEVLVTDMETVEV